MSLQELWQWVHYSYGEELGITSSDDIDYILLSSEEKIQFQMRVQREEKLAEQNIDYNGSIRLDSLMNKVSYCIFQYLFGLPFKAGNSQ